MQLSSVEEETLSLRPDEILGLAREVRSGFRCRDIAGEWEYFKFPKQCKLEGVKVLELGHFWEYQESVFAAGDTFLKKTWAELCCGG